MANWDWNGDVSASARNRSSTRRVSLELCPTNLIKEVSTRYTTQWLCSDLTICNIKIPSFSFMLTFMGLLKTTTSKYVDQYVVLQYLFCSTDRPIIIMTKFIHQATLNFYRRLLKTMMKTFTGDYEMFHRSRLEARKKMIENEHLRDPVQIQEKIFFGEEIRDFLTVNVIQGTVQENGNMRLKARPQHGVSSSVKDGFIK